MKRTELSYPLLNKVIMVEQEWQDTVAGWKKIGLLGLLFYRGIKQGSWVSSIGQFPKSDGAAKSSRMCTSWRTNTAIWNCQIANSYVHRGCSTWPLRCRNAKPLAHTVLVRPSNEWPRSYACFVIWLVLVVVLLLATQVRCPKGHTATLKPGNRPL